MSNLPNHILHYKQFAYHKQERTFSIEASEIKHWKPADLITIQGKKAKVTYRLSEVVRDPHDEDILAYELAPMGLSRQNVPSCVGTKIVIFND